METILEKELMKIGQKVIVKNSLDGETYIVEVAEVSENHIHGPYIFISQEKSLKHSVDISISVNCLTNQGAFSFKDYVFEILCDVQSS